MESEPWNNRYSNPDYIYGESPNVFFKEQLDKLPAGNIFLPGDGEGRNGVYAAVKGWDVTSVDWSEAGKNKALKLCEKHSVNLNYLVSDLLEYRPAPASFDAAASIFVHFAEEQRVIYHKKLIEALKPGGTLFLIAYSKEQIGLNTGGPREDQYLYSLEDVIEDFIDLDFKLLTKDTIEIYEGQLHKGKSSVIKFSGTRS